MTANDEIRDRAIAHQVYLLRYQARLVREITDTLKEVEADLLQQLAKLPTQAQSDQLEAQLVGIRALIAASWDVARAQLNTDLTALAEYEANHEEQIIRDSVPVELEFVMPAPQLLVAAVESKPAAAMTAEQFEAAQRLVRRIPVGEKVVEAILKLVRNGRPETSDYEQVRKHVAWGPGPRASQALMLAARARALMDGRLSPSTDDVLALAAPVLRHRMALNFSARADGVTLDNVIALLCEKLR